MNPIDLTEFAEHSQKIPSAILSARTTPTMVPAKKILSALFVDLCLVLGSVLVTKIMCTATVKLLLPSAQLKHLFAVTNPALFFEVCVPFFLMNYFFFSFFFNEGQSYGMSKQKIRVPMPAHDFLEAFKGSSEAMIVFFSLGMVRPKVVPQDDLYESLMLQKDVSAPALPLSQEEAPEHYSKAA